MMFDLDRFKAINDTFGHPAGDAVLKEAAQRLAASVRTVDRVARIGGEEFALILVQTDGAAALEAARRAIQGVAREPIRIGGQTLEVTASAGVASLPADAATAAELFAAADRALFAAKAGGRRRAIPAWDLRGEP
jgi:diguanylate cyclase (GGDEF)-like protein